MLVFVYEKITNFADNGNFEIKMDNGLIYSDIELFWGGEEEECGGMAKSSALCTVFVSGDVSRVIDEYGADSVWQRSG